ncbi:MAG TPA: hypothetical protein DCY18_00565, partial [Thauera sp.]|nr:hypothetical protein [Thauera sp.]
CQRQTPYPSASRASDCTPVKSKICCKASRTEEVKSHTAGYAIASGALTSGMGYAVWYAALRHLRATTASTVQLSVPVIAALGGAALLAEPVTGRLVLASAAVLGGI